MNEHHGSGPNDELRDTFSKMMKNTLGEFPDGKLSTDDEGSIPIGVGHVSGRVKIMFPKPVMWTAMPPEQAIDLAESIIQHAKRACGYNPELEAKIADLRAKLA